MDGARFVSNRSGYESKERLRYGIRFDRFEPLRVETTRAPVLASTPRDMRRPFDLGISLVCFLSGKSAKSSHHFQTLTINLQKLW
jgi:hypothetical protein